jgi:hypothetical protein
LKIESTYDTETLAIKEHLNKITILKDRWEFPRYRNPPQRRNQYPNNVSKHCSMARYK